MPKSMPTSGESLESGVSAEVHRLPVRRESKRMRVFHARKSPLDHRVARHCNRLLVIAARVSLRARGDRRVAQTRLIRLDTPSRTQARVRFFVDRSKTCI